MKSTKKPRLYSDRCASAQNRGPEVSPWRRSGARWIGAVALAVALCFSIAGCGASPIVQLGAISVATTGTPSITISSVAINNQAALSISLDRNAQNLDVSWSLNCGGSPIPVPSPAPTNYNNPDPNPCGTLSKPYGPSTTFTAPPYLPVGSTVTITATAASNPSVASSIALPIVPLPITVAISTPSPQIVGAKGTASLTATVKNDDTKAAGLNWSLSCAPTGSDCGSLKSELPNSQQTASAGQIIYTAPLAPPANGVVTITATSVTDPTKSNSTTVIVKPISIGVTPSMVTVPASSTASLMATVAFDGSDQGVTWSIAACGTTTVCGSLSTNRTDSGLAVVYTAPASVPSGSTVTVTAASTANSAVFTTVTITVTPPLPIVVTVLPTGPSTQVQGTVSVTATVVNDLANKGVDWTLSCGSTVACGSITAHTASGVAATYTAPSAVPSGGTVVATATSTTDKTKSAAATITIVPPLPIVVTVLPTGVSAQVTGSLPLTATVVNDDLADAGADWTLTCGSAGSCGSITAHTASGNAALYTTPSAVPSGGTVTATATSTTDNTKSAAATITILPAISVAFTSTLPTSVNAGVGSSFTAAVANDVANAGVDWTATCASTSCGTFVPSHTDSVTATTFTLPSGAQAGTVTITATSTASNTLQPLRSVSAKASITPIISVVFVPYAPTQMQVSTVVNSVITSTPISLIAVVPNDSSNAGVDWSVCSGTPSDTPATCGQFQITPALAATSTAPAANAVYSQTVHTASGQAVSYIPPSQLPSSGGPGMAVITAKAHTASVPPATATVNIVATPLGVPLNGVVMAGTQPVAGAAVSLYAAGVTGYSSAASVLNISSGSTQVLTGTAGQFAIPGGYTCPSQSSQMYLVAVGGNAGGGVNPNLTMMTALGPCGGLSSAVNITINEVTTIGSIWPLAPFMTDYAHVGSSSTNANTGMGNAFATVNNLVNIMNGQALAATPADNGVVPATGVVPQAEINTLAGVLNGCATTAGGAVGDGSPCGILFGLTNPTIATNTAPVDTLHAALNLAQSPQGVGNQSSAAPIYNLLPANPPFSPVLTTAPNDWTISINFTGGGLGTRSIATGLAIDALGDVWITNNRFSSVTEFNSLGAALSPPATGTTSVTAGGYQGGGLSSPGAIAIDPLGNAWIANGNGSLTELSPYGVAVSPSGVGYTGGGLTGQRIGLAIDSKGNVWTVSGSTQGDVSWFAGANATFNGVPTPAGTPLSPTVGFSQGGLSSTGGIGIDLAGTVWVLNSTNNSAAEFSSLNGTFIQSDFGYQQAVPVPVNSALSQGVGTSLAIDNAGNVYLATGNPPGQLSKLLPGGSSSNAGGLGAAYPSAQSVYSAFLALDGAGHVWFQINGSDTCISGSQVLYSLLELSSSGIPLNANAVSCGYRATSLAAADDAIGVDGSGDIWVLGTGSVTEFIGVAAPVVTPLSLGLQNNTLDKKP